MNIQHHGPKDGVTGSCHQLHIDDDHSLLIDVALPYKQWFSLIETPDNSAKIRLQRAGHILGSAYVELDVNQTRIVFSGDLGAPHTPLLPAPKPPYKADILVLESTYGDRNHENRATRQQRLKAAIDHALENQGTVLIPAFSIGRTQELLYEFEEILDGQLPVILDSPLASRFTQIYRELKPFWNEEAHARLKAGRKPLAFDNLLTVESHDDHLKMVQHLSQSGRPAIVISGSGMCTAGRIVNYLKAMLGDERHDILFVGYQAEGTPGRIIQQYGPRNGYVELDGERYTIKAKVDTIGGYSGHADQNGLVRFVKGMKQKPSQIRLVHGNQKAKDSLKQALQKVVKSNIS